MNNRPIFLLILFGILLFSSGCEEVDEAILCVENDCFSFDKFRDGIAQGIEGQCVGCGFHILENESLRKFYYEGESISGPDGSYPFTGATEMHVASVSKTITAIALMKSLADNGVPAEDSIYKYLPPGWEYGPNIETITFHELMRHRTGFRDNGNFHADLKQMLINGINLSDKGMQYQNENFSLMRYFIATLNGSPPPTDDPGLYGFFYVSYINENILGPAGVYAECKPTGGQFQALYYNYNTPNESGWPGSGDLSLEPGGYGWNMSLGDMGWLFSKFWTTNIIMGDSLRNTMVVNNYGLIGTNGERGFYSYHNGGWLNGGSTLNGDNCAGSCKGLRTIQIHFPENDVTAVFMMNNWWHPGMELPRTIIVNAYDAAWEPN